MNRKALPLYAFSFFMIMPMHALFPLLPVIRDEIGASYSQIAAFLATMGVVRLTMAFPSGFLADRFDKKYILLFSGLLCLAGLIVMALAQSFAQMMVSRVLIGLSSIVCNIAVLALLAQLAGPGGRGVMLSMNNVVHNAGGILSPALAGMLAKWYSWRVAFLAVAGMVVLSMVLVAAFLERPTAPSPDSGKGSGSPPARPFRANAGYWLLRLAPVFGFGFFVFFYRGYFRHTLLPFMGRDVFQLDVDTLGLYFSLTAAVALVSLWGLGALSDRFGRRAVVVPGVFLSTLAPLLLLLPQHAHPFLLGCLFVGLGAVINSMPNVLISDLVAPGVFGRVIGVNRTIADSGYFLGTIAAGILLDRFGFRIPILAIAGYAGGMLVLLAVFMSGKTAESRP